MNARKRGLSHEITAGASTSLYEREHAFGIVAGGVDEVRHERRELLGRDAVVERDRIEGEPVARVREHRVGDALRCARRSDACAQSRY